MADSRKCSVLVKILEHICKSYGNIMVLWSENKTPVGNVGRIDEVREEEIIIELFDEDLIPEEGKCVVIRNCLFTRPIRGTVKGTDKNKVVIGDQEFIMVEHEKRRFLRVFLEKPLNGRISVGLIDIQMKIFDISEEGVGFFSVCDKELERFKDSGIEVSFLLDNKHYINSNGRFAWISKYGYNKYIGGIQIKPTVEQRYIILHFLTNYMYKVEENLLKILEGSE